MSLFVILAVGFVGYVLWTRSAPIRAGGWRVGAGLISAVLIVTGTVAAIIGKEWLALPMVALGLTLAFFGRVGRGRFKRPPPERAEAMSVTEARSILGVGEGASTADIKAAYMRLMKRNHPDQGGTSGLASKLNAARDRLLKGD